MRHAAITPVRSEARLGLRRPTEAAGGRHTADGLGSGNALDAPTVVLASVSAPQPGSDVFAGRGHLFTVGGSGATPGELWGDASTRGRAAVLVGASLAVMTLALTGGHHPASSPTYSSTAASSTPSSSTTPLGCDVHEVHDGIWNTATDDPYCTQRQLATQLCDLDLVGRPQVAGTLQRWSGTDGEAILSGTGSSMSFMCGTRFGEEHMVTFTADEWDDLISPGSMTSAQRTKLASN